MTVTREDFARRLLATLGYENRRPAMVALVAWQRAEGTAARFNPLATTHQMKGSTDFNSAGVQDYTSLAQGLKATAWTLGLDYYTEIRRQLELAESAAAILEAVADSPWGTGDLALSVLQDTKRDYDTWANQPIGQA